MALTTMLVNAAERSEQTLKEIAGSVLKPKSVIRTIVNQISNDRH